MRRAIAVGVMSFFALSEALAHAGGLNAEGCHHNRKTGDYHCHRAPTVPMPSGAAQPLVGEPRAAPATRSALPPGCYVGPRGGTYTITSSGRKNYSGC